MVKRFNGRREYGAFAREVEAEEWTVSPGGAAAILGVSRQMIHKLIDGPNLRAWAYYDGIINERLTELHISVRDVLRYGMRVGRIESFEDVGLRFPALRDLVAEVGEEVAEKEVDNVNCVLVA